MLAYDHTSAFHPWEQQLPDSSHEAYMQSLDPQAYAYAALGQSAHSMPSMDALQSMLLQSSGDHNAGQLDLAQLLAHLPTPPGLGQVPPGLSPAASSPQQQLLHASSASSLQFDTTAADAWMHAAASGGSSPTTGLPQEQLNSGPRLFVPDSLKAAAAVAGSSSPNQHQLLLQAALGQQQSGMADPTNMLHEQLLLQAALQQQQAANTAQAQPNLQAALLAALSAGAAPPPGLGQAPAGVPMPNSNAANMWPFMPPGLTDTTAATAAALLAAQQQQQQQAAITRALASMTLAGGADPNALLQQALLAQQGFAAAPAAAGVLNQLQPWAVKALATRMQQQGAGASLAGCNQLASLLNNTSAAGAGHLPRTASLGAQGRRRSGRRSSGTAAAAADLAGYGGFAAASRANSIAGSDMADSRTSSGIPAVLPAGVNAKDLCPTKYEDTWASTDTAAAEGAAAPATATAASISSDGSCQLARGSSSASTSSIESSATDAAASICGSALSLSSSGRQGSGAAGSGEDRWQWDSHFCSLDDDAMSQGSSGVSGRACRKAAAAAAAAATAAKKDQAQQPDDTKASKDQTPAHRKAAVAAAGCPVWLPGAREAAGDDSWYLPRPPTCRLFVGNIGCWVDEAMLLAYFGKYGHVVDVQVMWNTKMLARGRRVNREFAFISYSSPLEAARAVHWLDGCRLPDMEKDKNGVTVEYENGEGDSPATK